MAARTTMKAFIAKATQGVVLVGALTLSGCGSFFVPVTQGGGGGGGGGGTGTTTNLVYTANSLTSTVSGFSIGTSTLTSAPSMPYTLGFSPQASVMTIANTFLYVAGPGAIYAYNVASDGSLTAPTAGAGQVVVYALAMDVTPDGNWLIALDGTTTQLDVFAINKTTGALALTATAPYSITTSTVQPKMVKVSSGGNLIFAALGTGGDLVFTFNTTTGAAALSQTLGPVSTQTSDNALAVDSTTSFLYIARSGTKGGLAVYSIGAAGLLTSVAGSPFAAGTQPLAVAVNSTGKFAYVANGSDGTVSGYSLVSGVATPLSGSPYASGATVASIAIDRTGTYLLAAAFGGSPDLTLYTFDTLIPGKLNQVATAATGNDPAGALMVTAAH
jgi:6-phosphogluconolactonase